jgi:hypothetical protein
MGWRTTIAAILGLAGAAMGISQAPALKAEALLALTSEERAWLRAHNAARRDFGSAPLQWSPRLSHEAYRWARRLAREERLRHSSTRERGETGENLWLGTAGHFTPEQMVAHLIDERRYFKPGTFPNVSRTGNWADVGHYTQIVWQDTREVGCAKARGRRFDVLVCRYYPGGNVIGQRIAAR